MTAFRRISKNLKPAVAIFARAPKAGKVKTRLIPLLGARGAAEFQAALFRDGLAKLVLLRGRAVGYVFVAGGELPSSFAWNRERCVRQRGKDLGERLKRAFRRLLDRHDRVVVIGTDSPELPPLRLRQAFAKLRNRDAVLGPSPDGGYYLIGLRRFSRDLFDGIRWGSRFARRDTLERLKENGLSCALIESCPDVDRPSDLKRLARRMKTDVRLRRLSPETWKFVERHLRGARIK